MEINRSKHLSKEEQVKLGSYYTPKKLVDMAFKFIQPYAVDRKKNVVIFDSAAGCGAFVARIKKYDYRAADCDTGAGEYLKKRLDGKKIFLSNSLLRVSRKKYVIPAKSFLIMVGNPPYNDTTSEFRNGRKGRNLCDQALFDRDLGVSFLKSYDKLKANLVCVLHPLSYLIKKTNFKRLKSFKDNYRLKRGVIFPSSWFLGTGSIKFPIVIGLYERDKKGMDFDYIKNFSFSILDSRKKFKLARYKTTDGYIDKYPPRKNGQKISPLGLYYYTFRDFNSLRKNTSFLDKRHPNGIVVTVNNFYKYAYLSALKKLFKARDIWLYGNLSPLINKKLLEKNKKIFIEHAVRTSPTLKKTNRRIVRKIARHYKVGLNKRTNIAGLETAIKKYFRALVS